MMESFKNFEVAGGKVVGKKEKVPLDIVERRAPYIHELGLSQAEMQWLANIFHDIDEEAAIQERVEAREKEIWKGKESEPKKRVDFEELLDVYLSEQRDIKKHGTGFVSSDTEEKIEIILTDLYGLVEPDYGNEGFEASKKDRADRESQGEYTEYATMFNKWCNEVEGLKDKSPKEKASLLSKFLTIHHGGGRRMGFDFFSPNPNIFYESERGKGLDLNDAEDKFMEALNNLGNASYWERHPKALSTMRILDRNKKTEYEKFLDKHYFRE